MFGNRERNSDGQQSSKSSCSHLKSHSQRHLFSFKPFDNDTRNRNAGNFYSDGKCGISQCRYHYLSLDAQNSPGIIGEKRRYGKILDGCPNHHDSCRGQSGKTNTHFVQNDTTKNKHQQKYIEPSISTGKQRIINATP